MKAVLLRFLILLFLLLGLTSVATYYFYSEDVKQLHHQIQDRERSRHLSNLHITRLHFSPIIDDLNYLTEKAKETLLSTPSQFEQQMVASFIRMSRTRGYYDQIRLIDSKGQEIIRVDRNEGKSTLVAKSQLQNKNHRNYIQSALKIPLDSIFTSQFDLNTEHGKIEHPYKPTIRFISHFKVGGKRWLLSFNYLGEDYLSELKRQFGSTDVQNWLINNHGQWLLGPNGQEWLFMADPERRPSDDFLTQYPTLWQQILSHPKGQYVQDGFLYTYTRFFSGSSFSGHNHFTLPFKGTDLPWTIISRVNLDQAVANLAYSPSRVIKFIVLGILLVSLLSGCMALSWHLFQLLSAQRILSQANEDSAKKYRTVLKHAPDGLLTINEKGEIITINQAAKTILNITNQDTEGRILIKQLSGIQARKEVKNLIKDIKGKNYKSGPLKTRIQLKNLKTKHIEIIATQTLYSNSTEILLNLRDITHWIEREEKLKSMSRALEQSHDAIIITDYKGIIEYVNPSFEKNNKVKHEDVVGTQSINLLRQALLSNNEVFEVQQQLKSGQTIERIITHRDKGDDIIYEEKTIAPIRNNRGKISHYISTGKDITERVLFENKIHRLAHYDILTELPNRMLFQQDLERAIAQAGLTKSVSLMILNLDQFKHVNDSYDHEVGDKVIQSIAKRLKHTLREGDILARLGGDEFAILVSQNLSPTEIAQMASRIISHISSPLAIDSLELFLTASIGISIYPQDSTNPEEINKYADIALHRAKELGRNQFCFYTSQMRVESSRLHQLESELRKSLGTDQYALYYQPKVNSRSHKICGVEALLRWHNPQGEIQPPLEIIPILERSGLIIDVGEDLIYRACKQLRQWQDNNIFLYFALNISARQLLNSHIVETVQNAITESGCDPNYLELEITESVLMSDVKNALDKLIKLEAIGVKIAIDDFGTGYSSLAYLNRFPIHILKVDREFVKDLPWSNDNITITRSIIELAHNLNMRVVAEGVENEGQADFLASVGVEEFQGYYFGRPMPIPEFDAMYGFSLTKRPTPYSDEVATH